MCGLLVAFGRLKLSFFLRTREAPYPWLIACDAGMEAGKIARVPAADVCTCRSKKQDEIEVERVCDCVVVCNRMRKKHS